MKRERLTRVATGLTAVMCLPVLIGATSLTGNFPNRVLAAHNRERAALGVAPLKWDQKLQASAENWANHLATTNAFEHAPDIATEPQGENLWEGTRGHYSAEAMVDGWINEKQFFRAGVFPNNSTTGRVADVGHYTQLMWRGTGRVGCALAAGRHEEILVCRYSDAGNYLGERPF